MSADPNKLLNTLKSPQSLTIILLIAINLLIGIFVFDDYGESWDENLLYEYARSSASAYNIWDWWDGNFEITEHYGPSNHRYYGPAYLIFAQKTVDILSFFLPNTQETNLWHLTYFLTFQISLVLLYILCRRFMNTWTALGSVFLFNTQPLLWGHAFINPKDIPFLVFFLATIVSGFWLVDSTTKPTQKVSHNQSNFPKNLFSSNIWLIVYAILFLFTSFITLLRNILDTQIAQIITNAAANPDKIMGRLFYHVAQEIDATALESYISKSLTLFHRFQFICIIAILLFAIPTLHRFFPAAFNQYIKKHLIPFSKNHTVRRTVLAGIILGLCIAIRVIGPLAGLLVIIYLWIKAGKKSIPIIVGYGLVAIITAILSWPYLWEHPIIRFVESVQVMSQFPYLRDVLFNGTYYRASMLPAGYFPTLLLIKLSEIVFPLFVLGLIAAIIKYRQNSIDRPAIILMAAWFFIPFFGVIVFKPAMYDNFRQFLFILPPVFVFCGTGLELLCKKICQKAVFIILLLVFSTPGLLGLLHLHPYQYTYFNKFVGGLSGASHRFETDYWATAIREATEYVNQIAPPNAHIVVSEPPHLAWRYAREDINLEMYLQENVTGATDITYAIATTKLNFDKEQFPDAKIIYRVERNGAIFAVVKDVANTTK